MRKITKITGLCSLLGLAVLSAYNLKYNSNDVSVNIDTVYADSSTEVEKNDTFD